MERAGHELKHDRYVVKYLLPVVLWMTVIFITSSMSPDEFPHVEFWGWAKLIHLIYYGVLFFLCHRALSTQTRFPALARHSYLLGVIFAVVYGATDEWHQLSTPGRHGQFTDVMIDAFGALLFLGGMWINRILRSRVAAESPGE